MKHWIVLGRAGRMLGMGASVAVGLAGASVLGGPAVAACQSADDMAETFLSVYPTGGRAAHIDGDHAEKIIHGLAVGGDGDSVMFFYSGDGPTTGNRGRYMYLILDGPGCIVHSDWVDGDVFDRLSSTE